MVSATQERFFEQAVFDQDLSQGPDVLYATFDSGSREPPNPNGLLVTPDWYVAE